MAAAKNPNGKKIYGVLKNLSHDRQEYSAGDSVELTEKQAKDLIAAGVLLDPDEKTEESENT